MSMTTQWLHIQNNLQKTLDSGQFKVWIAPLTGVVDGTCVRVNAPNSFVANWVKDRLGLQISRAAAAVLSCPLTEIHLEISVLESSACEIVERKPALVSASALVSQERNIQMALPLEAARRDELPAWRFSFDDFVVGPCNELAYAATRTLCNASGIGTLFLHSGCGLGKTHLAHAAGKALCAVSNRDHVRVEYLTAEEFASRFVLALRAREIERFKARYRGVDVLLLEDIHFFQGKEKMQDEALSTIRALQARGSRVILTSSFAPREMNELDEQFVSQLGSAFLARIDRPDFSTRRSIVQEKSRAQHIVIADDVSEMLAENVSSDVRQLESCLNNLIMKARLLNRSISMDFAREVVSQYTANHPHFTVHDIMEKVAKMYGITCAQLVSDSRRQNYVLARNTAFYLARKHTELSLQEIGERFHRRHSTVMKGIANVEREIRRESPLGRQIADAVQRIEQPHDGAVAL